MKNAKIALILCFIFIAGCGVTREEVRRFMFGMNLSDFENAEQKFSQAVEGDIGKIYAGVLEDIKKCKLEINVREDKDYFLVVYKFDKLYIAAIDTTEVGLRLKSIGQNKTEITAVSDNYELAKFALDIFVTRNIPEPQKKQSPL